MAYYQRILANEPLNLITLYNVGDLLHRQGLLEESKAAFRRLLELNPEDWGTHTQLGIILLKQGHPEEAWAELELEVDSQQQEIGRIHALPALGRKEEAQQRLDIFVQENQSWAAYPIAGIYASYGDSETAFTWLELAYQQRDSSMSGILSDPLLISLHDDPRWAGLLDRMGLPH